MINISMLIRATLLLMLASLFASCDRIFDKSCKLGAADTMQLNIRDSACLEHIAGDFYRAENERLFMKTLTWKEGKPDQPVYYFSGSIPQFIDPSSFEQLVGFYAKDKNHVYVTRPVYGGTFIYAVDSADLNSFESLEEHYWYAKDKNHLYELGQILPGINPKTMKLVLNEIGELEKFVDGSTVYKVNN